MKVSMQLLAVHDYACILTFFWHHGKVQNEAIPTVPLDGQTEEWKALKLGVEAANGPKWAQRNQGSIWELGGGVGDGAGKRVMKCEMCTENDKVGRGWERQLQ
jgi:hypothetical protein